MSSSLKQGTELLVCINVLCPLCLAGDEDGQVADLLQLGGMSRHFSQVLRLTLFHVEDTNLQFGVLLSCFRSTSVFVAALALQRLSCRWSAVAENMSRFRSLCCQVGATSWHSCFVPSGGWPYLFTNHRFGKEVGGNI